MNLFNFVFQSLDFISHCEPFLFEKRPEFFVQIGKSLGLVRILFNLAVFAERLLSDLLKVLVTLLLDPLHVPDFLIE